jgi:hypothetical protein
MDITATLCSSPEGCNVEKEKQRTISPTGKNRKARDQTINRTKPIYDVLKISRPKNLQISS